MSASSRITIVIACYNVEKYIARCFDSILEQTHQGIEIIAIDDCSTDATKKVIQRYAKKHKNFTAIYNKQNRGQGYCRNIGIEKTKTKYIAFVDSDDWIEKNFLEALLSAMITGKADIAVCDIFVKHDNPAPDHRVVMYDKKPNKLGLINTGLAASSCNKLFKTELFRTIRYPVNLANDDIEVILALMNDHKAVYTDKTYYNYYQRPGSTQNGNITSRRLDVFKSVDNLRENVSKKIDSKIWESIVWHQVVIVLLAVLPKAKGVLHRRQLIAQFVGMANERELDILSNPGFIDYMSHGTLNTVYAKGVRFMVKHNLFLLCSFYMGLYMFYLNHKHPIKTAIKVVRLPYTFARDPRGVINRTKSMIFKKNVIRQKISLTTLISEAKKQSKIEPVLPVSVVIPNYNYENFLLERVYSILHQTHKIGELLILDDNSTDGSVKLAKKIKAAIGEYVPVKLINNTENQGTFRQWRRGFREAKYDHIWIAEADDYSHSSFLASVMKPFRSNDNIVIGYVDTGFVDGNGVFIESARRHIDYQNSGHWDSDYVIDGREEVERFSYLNNTIANVSSVVFQRRPDIDYEAIFSESSSYRQAGDWVFYVNYAFYGDIAYVNKTFNYYRMHGSNVTASTKAKIHLAEIEKIYKMLDARLQLTDDQKQKQQKRIKMLKKAWNI